MDAWVWVLIAVIVLAAIAVVAYVVVRQRRRQELRDSFGPEYELAVAREGDVRRGESDLIARRERRANLDIRPLSPSSREAYARSWEQTQARFVDNPASALAQADALIVSVMEARGYPMNDFERRAEDISVDDPDVVQHYRAAHDISSRLGDAQSLPAAPAAPTRPATTSAGPASSAVSTEDMRQGLVHYRFLFERLLEPDQEQRTQDRATG